MQEIDIVDQFRKCWDLASELAEKETKERFGDASYIFKSFWECGDQEGESEKMRRTRISRGEYKLDRLERHMLNMTELFAIQYGGGVLGE